MPHRTVRESGVGAVTPPPRRGGLGRGLDSLLPTSGGTDSLEQKGLLDEIEVDHIDPNPRQPRVTFEDESLAELTTSIRELGILQPLLVRAMPTGRFELIAGERRLRAGRAAGLTSVPVVIVETDDRGSLERALVENLHRSDLNAIEEAAGYKQLIEDGGLTQEALGERLGRTRGTISNSLRLLDLPVAVQRLIVERKLSGGHGRALLGLENPVLQERLAKRVACRGTVGPQDRGRGPHVSRHDRLGRFTAARAPRPRADGLGSPARACPTVCKRACASRWASARERSSWTSCRSKSSRDCWE